MSALASLVADRFLRTRPREAARVLDRLPPEQVALALDGLDARVLAEVLERMGQDTASRTLAALAADFAGAVLSVADPVRVAGWLALLDEEVRIALVSKIPPTRRRAVGEALDYPPGTAGQLMDARVVAFDGMTTVAEVFARLRHLQGLRIMDVVVCDAEGRLTGLLSLQALVTADAQAHVGSLTPPDPLSVTPMAGRDQIVELLARHAIASLPVVDYEQKLLGILRYDALVRAAEQAATDDLQQMVGASKEERALSTPWFTIRSRLPWLVINLLTAFAASAVVSVFDGTIAHFTMLAVLMPVVAGQAGNTGAQALAVTSRGLALREIRLAHTGRVLAKELTAAFGNGLAIASLTSVAVFIWSGSAGLAAVIGLSMILSLLIAACAGASIPIVLSALKRDPATASSIILTTITDITGMSSFLGLATLLQTWLRP